MKNKLNLSVSEQNIFNQSLFDLAIAENINYAKESEGESVADYFIRDFEASPEGWNCAFEFSYDEISAAAKQARKQTLILMLANEGYLQSEI